MKNKWYKPTKIIMLVTSVITGMMGLAFLIQTLRIYGSKNNPMYTREVVGEYLLQILAIIILWIIAIIIGVVFTNLSHYHEKNLVKTSHQVKLKNLLMLLPKEIEQNEDYEAFQKQNKRKMIVRIVVLVILLFCLLMSCLYLFNPKHFVYDGHPTDQIKKMALHLLPWFIISFGALIGLAFYEEWHAKQMIQIVKSLLVQNGKQKMSVPVSSKKEFWIINITRAVLLTCAVTLIIVGALTGGADGVLQKAINICTECIGLG